MAIEYPGALFDADQLADAIVSPADWDKVVRELRAGLGTLGVNPQGADASVLARLDRLDSLIATFGQVGFRQLRVNNDVTTPNAKVLVEADVLVCEGSVLSALSLFVDITVAGKNGLSTGSEAANTWYYVWVGHNPTTGERAGIFDPSSLRTGITLSHASLSGFTRWVRVGAVRNNASSNFLRFVQQDRRVLYPGDDGNTDLRVLNGGLAASFTNVDCSKVVPVTARQAALFAIMSAAGGGGDVFVLGAAAGTFSGAGYRLGSLAAATEERLFLWLPLSTAQLLQYKVSVPGGGLTLYGAGYEDAVG